MTEPPDPPTDKEVLLTDKEVTDINVSNNNKNDNNRQNSF